MEVVLNRKGVDGVDEGGGGRALLATRDDNDPMRFRKEICNILQSVTISRVESSAEASWRRR